MLPDWSKSVVPASVSRARTNPILLPAVMNGPSIITRNHRDWFVLRKIEFSSEVHEKESINFIIEPSGPDQTVIHGAKCSFAMSNLWKTRFVNITRSITGLFLITPVYGSSGCK